METCSICFKPKAKLDCGICKEPICKNCTVFLEDENFAFLKPMPDDYLLRRFCPTCYDAKVDPALKAYELDIEKARQVFVFYKTENKESRFFKRVEKPIKVSDCTDREELILRLAYLAVKANCNTIVDVELTQEKIKMGAYQTSNWSGTANPVEADPQKIEKKSKQNW
jgi:hypothetical protein